MKSIELSVPNDRSYEPYREMCEEFLLRLHRNSGISAEKMYSSPLGSTLLPNDLKINYEKKVELPAPKRHDIYLAQKERQLIAEALSFADVSWNSLLACCTYNCEADLRPLRNYYEAFPALRNAMRVMNKHIMPEKLAKYLHVIPFHAFQFRFLDFPDSILRKCQLYIRGYAVSFYERIRCLQDKDFLDDKIRQKLFLDKSLSESVDKVLNDWAVFTEHSSLNRNWFGDEAADHEMEYVKLGEMLGYVVVGLALSRWSLDMSLEEVDALLELDREQFCLLSQFQYIELYESGNVISIYNNRSSWLVI